MRQLNISDITANSIFKFVRLQNGEIRFLDIEDKHCDVVAPGEKAIGAGVLAHWGDFIRVEQDFSPTLNVRMCKDDYERLSSIFGLPVRDKIDHGICQSN